jgi:predicted NodU family carbamoyl transferase
MMSSTAEFQRNSIFGYFTVRSEEYKLMGLAPYGEPRWEDMILRELVDLREDGSLKLKTRCFGFLTSLRMPSPGASSLETWSWRASCRTFR